MEIGHIEFISFEEYKNKAIGNQANTSNKVETISNEEIEKEMMGVVRYYEQSKRQVEK